MIQKTDGRVMLGDGEPLGFLSNALERVKPVGTCLTLGSGENVDSSI